MITRWFLAGAVCALAACSGPDNGVQSTGSDGESGGVASLVFSEPQPIHHRVELLQNRSFEEEVGGMVRSWQPNPANAQWKISGGKTGGGFVLRPPAAGRAQVEQVFGLHPLVKDLTLKAQAEVRCTAPGAVVLEVEFDCDGKKRLLTRENTDTQNWEPLVIKTKLPAGANPDNITLRLAAYGIVDVAAIDEASAMMTDEPADLLDNELLLNGSFERTIEGQVERWEVLPRTVGSVEQGEAAAGKSLFKLAPRPGGGYSTLQQHFDVSPDAAGLKVNAQVKVKGVAAKKVAFALARVVDQATKVIASAENSGGEDWETLTLTADIPADDPPAQLLFRIGLRPGAETPVLIDEASVKLAK